MRYTLRSLSHRNYRLYYLGQLVSLTGTWMQQLAQAWLIYRLTGSGLMLGMAGAAALLPNLLFGLYGGVLADRLPRKRLLLIAQALAMLQAFALAALTLTGAIAPWHILLLALLLGTVQALELPARHSFVAQLVPREDLANAIALNSSLFHASRLIGPAVAGALIVAIGEGWVFLINGFTFIAVLLGLLAIRLPVAPAVDATGDFADFTNGIRYAWHHLPIRATLAMVAAVSLFGSSASVLMPVFAVEVYQAGAQSLGLLLSAIGAGALIGALALAGRRDIVGFERLIAIGGLGAGVLLLLFSATQLIWLAVPLLALIGFCITSVMAAANAFIQLAVPDNLRGRVMSLFALALHGMLPLGHLAMGAGADALGAPVSVAIGALALFAAASVASGPLRAAALAQGAREARRPAA